MSAALLRELALRAGIELEYRDSWNHRHIASEKTQRALLHAVGLACASEREIRASLAKLQAQTSGEPSVEPPIEHAWRPSALQGDGRRWGISVQLYGLRSARQWGIGDFSDLRALVRGAATLGAAAVGINPLHALFPARPEHASPYSPSSRRFINPLYLDVEAIEDFRHCTAAHQYISAADFQAKLAAARESQWVDYKTVAALKWPVLIMSYRRFREQCLAKADDRDEAFRVFQREQGNALRRFAIFHALAETQVESDWRRWPRPLTDPDSAAVEEFAATHLDAVEFHEYLQWQAALQLDAANATARECGMSIGLYADLAVGADPAAAEVWSAQGDFVRGATIGAPPDALNLSGQDWGLPPLDPIALAASGCAPYAELLRANMRRVGALRIDHILGLMRFYWIPHGAQPDEGAYVRYPWTALFDVLAKESRGNHCLVIGEDLGTVPDGLRDAMHRRGMLSYRLLYFEERDGAFPPPEEYPADALIAARTHDLPSLPMWWRGGDIELRERLGLWPNVQTREKEIRHRELARRAVMEVLRAQDLHVEADVPNEVPVEAVYTYLARTLCKLLMVQFEDVLGQRVQVNVPGTTDQYPNWRARMPCSVEEAVADVRMRQIAQNLNASGRRDER
ncbi:MAG TPA: 4-alpha-glucanotransferase [Rhodanobacteraceae bacterium]|nr:4-alpha-glucanotransferase [Rhodanobacteraceae bacterium]